jgi:hypothetical protein
MTSNEILNRARSAAGKSIKYKLGGGGMSPKAATPANMNKECDCSGFACWVLGISRHTDHPLYVRFNDGWINTDAIVHDANESTGFFSRVDTPMPGDLLVFPSRPPKRKVGHVGIITDVKSKNGKIVPARVIHCSHGNHRSQGDAICETDASVFETGDAIIARWAGLES